MPYDPENNGLNSVSTLTADDRKRKKAPFCLKGGPPCPTEVLTEGRHLSAHGGAHYSDFALDLSSHALTHLVPHQSGTKPERCRRPLFVWIPLWCFLVESSEPKERLTASIQIIESALSVHLECAGYI